MTYYDVNNLSITTFASTIGVEDESTGTNTGNPITLATVTKTESEWGGLEPYQSVANNSHSILQLALTELQTLYPNKLIDLDGIYITETVV